MGIENTAALIGGTDAWRVAGLPMEGGGGTKVEVQ
jgi:rhodanese-related sulfurtransferase